MARLQGFSASAILTAIMFALGAADSAQGQTATVNASTDLRILSGGGSDTGALSLYNDGSNVQRTFLQFDLGSYSGQSITTSATLTLQAGIFGSTLTGVSIGTANSPWTAGTITWANQPALTAIPGATNPGGSFSFGTNVTWTIPWYMLEKMATAGTGYNNGLGITSGNGSTLHFYSSASSPSFTPTLSFSAASAAASTWTGGSGNWTDTANWAGSTEAQGIGQAATINSGSAVSITMDANRSVGSLAFSGADHTIGSGSGSLALNVISGAPSISVDTGRTATIGTTVVGIDGLTKQGAGTLRLTNANTYSGTTTISTGTLVYENAYASNAHSIASGAALELNVASGSRDSATTTFSGSGTLRKTGAGQVRWGSNAATFSLGAGALIDVQGGTFTAGDSANEVWTNNLSDLNVASGAIFDTVESNVRVNRITGDGTIKTGYGGAGYQNLTIGVGDGSSTFAGTIANSVSAGNVVKSGTGAIALSGVSTYTGTTTVNAGSLVLNAGGAIRGGGGIVVDGGAALVSAANWTTGDNGAYSAGRITINSGGTWTIDSVANGVLNGLVLNGGTVTGTTANADWGALYLRSTSVTAGGTATSTIAVDTTINAPTTMTVDTGSRLNYSGAIRNNVFGVGSITKAGAGTLAFSGVNTYTGATTISTGTLVYQNTYASPSHSIAAGAVLDLNVASGARDSATTTFSGSGTLLKTGTGQLLWAGGAATFSLGDGAVIDVQGGTFVGGSSGNENWTNNQSDLTVSSGATFDGVEANVRVNRITGDGTIKTGYSGAGYQNLTIGVGNGSSTFAGTIADSANPGNVVKSGTGAIALTGNNTFTGKTTVANGTLAFSLGNASATGTQSLGRNAEVDLGVAATSSGRLRYTGAAGTLAKNVNALGNGHNVIENAGTGLLTLSGTLTKNGTILTLAGGANGIDVTGAIVGSSANSDLSIDGGVTTLSTANTYNGSTSIFNGASLTANAVNALPTANGRTDVLMDQTGSGTSTFALGANQSIASLTGAASSSVNLGGFALTVGTSGSGTSTFAGSISGNDGSVTKDGSSVLILSGNNTYTGSTAINGGTLAVNGSLGNTAVSVASGATLGGSGSIAGSVNVLGTLSPGNSPGVITLGSLVLGGTSTTLIEITGTSRGTAYDGVDITTSSGLTYGGLLSLDFSSLGLAVPNDTTFDIFSFLGSPSGNFSSVTSTGLYAGTWTSLGSGSFQLVSGPQTLTFSQATGDIIVVPEPASLALAALGLATGVVIYRRRRA